MTDPDRGRTRSWRECEACGSPTADPVHEVDGYVVIRCRGCGLIFVGNPPAEERLPDLYGQAYWEAPDEPGYASYREAEHRKRHHFRGLLSSLERLVPARGDLLEVGSAYGYFLAEARERGWRVQGIEPSAHAAAEARERLGLAIHHGRLEDLPDGSASVDVVAMWDVIEHLPSPLRTLRAAARRLRPGGLLAVSTGDVGSLSARLHGRDWSLLTPPWHLFYFSRRTLAALVVRAGLQVVRVAGDGVVGIDPDSRAPRVPRPLRSFLLSRVATASFRRLGFGMTKYLYARKPPSP